MADQDFQIDVKTTADTSGLRQTSAELQKIREQQEKIRQDQGAAALFARIPPGPHEPPIKPPKEAADEFDRIGHSFERMALHAAGIGAVYKAIEAIKEAANQINKITESLDKQGEQLVKNVELMAEATRFAQTQADITKIGESGLKAIAEQHKNVLEVQKQELGYWDQLIDSIAKGGQLGVGPLQEALDSADKTAQRLEDTARKITIGDVLAAEAEKARQATLSLSEAESELNARIAQQQQLRLTALNNQDIEGYVKAGNAADQYQKKLEDVQKKKEQAQKATDQAISKTDPQVQRILQNEQAAAAAKAAGNERDADLFQKSADQYKESATPQQLQDLQKIHDLQNKLKPVEPPKYEPLSPEEFQKQSEEQEKLLGGPKGLKGDAAEAARQAEIENTKKAAEQAQAERYQQIQKEREKEGLSSMADPNSPILADISSKLDQLLGVWR